LTRLPQWAEEDYHDGQPNGLTSEQMVRKLREADRLVGRAPTEWAEA
jgi:hypothetical protein